MSKIVTEEMFQLRLKEIHPNLKSISPYIGMNKHIIVIDSLGIKYKTKPGNLLLGKVPTIQSAIDKNKAFEILAKQIHGNNYNYSKVIYQTAKIPIIIIDTKTNKEYFQIPGHHLEGYVPNPIKRGYSLSEWISYCLKYNKTSTIVYVIECYNQNERFIKIGMTSKSVKRRFVGTLNLPYKYKIIKEFKGSPEFSYKTELELHNKFKKYSYNPNLYFAGYTECFTLDVLLLL